MGSSGMPKGFHVYFDNPPVKEVSGFYKKAFNGVKKCLILGIFLYPNCLN